MRRWTVAILGMAALGLHLLTLPAITAQTADETKPAAAATGSTAQYVGVDTCKTCHEDLYKNSFEGTPHYKTTLKDGHGCESCHGPGSEHVAGGGDVTKIISFKNLSRQESNKRCLSCHAEKQGQAHFAESVHAGNDVGCLDCHSPHHAKEPQHLLVQKQPELCYGCHTAAKADFAKPFHHRVNEGLVQCTDCHNLHGSVQDCGRCVSCRTATSSAFSAMPISVVRSSTSTCR